MKQSTKMPESMATNTIPPSITIIHRGPKPEILNPKLLCRALDEEAMRRNRRIDLRVLKLGVLLEGGAIIRTIMLRVCTGPPPYLGRLSLGKPTVSYDFVQMLQPITSLRLEPANKSITCLQKPRYRTSILGSRVVATKSLRDQEPAV